jgi:MFS family permease
MAAAPRSLWRHGDFVRLWAGQSVSRLGTEVSRLAIPLVAIDVLHATTFEVGALTAIETLPFLLVGLPAGAWVDRMRRRRVLIAADVGRCAVLASIPLASSLGGLTMLQLYAVAAATGVLTVFFDVAYQSYLPALVDRDQLVDGNAKLAASEAGAQVAGPSVGGLLVHAVGAATAVLADAASYVLSFVSLLLIRRPEPVPVRHPEPNLRREIREGLSFVLREPRIRSVSATTGTANLFGAMTMAIIVVFMRRTLHLDAGIIGLVFGIAAAGALVGAVAARPLARRIGVGRAIVWSIALGGGGGLLYPLATRHGALLPLMAAGAIMAAGGVIYNINQVSVRQALCPLALQGRMNASVRFLVWGTLPLGGFAGGALGAIVGIRPTLWIAGIGGTAAFLWLLPSPVPGIREIPDQIDEKPPAAAAATTTLG